MWVKFGHLRAMSHLRSKIQNQALASCLFLMCRAWAWNKKIHFLLAPLKPWERSTKGISTTRNQWWTFLKLNMKQKFKNIIAKFLTLRIVQVRNFRIHLSKGVSRLWESRAPGVNLGSSLPGPIPRSKKWSVIKSWEISLKLGKINNLRFKIWLRIFKLLKPAISTKLEIKCRSLIKTPSNSWVLPTIKFLKFNKWRTTWPLKTKT